MSYTQYITVQGDRFDTIAYSAYGDASMYRTIVDANPQVSLSPEIQEGTLLRVPIIESSAQSTTASKLPPWKRK